VGNFAYDLLNRSVSSVWKENGNPSVQEHLQYDLAGNIVKMAREHSRYELAYDSTDQRTLGAPSILFVS